MERKEGESSGEGGLWYFKRRLGFRTSDTVRGFTQRHIYFSKGLHDFVKSRSLASKVCTTHVGTWRPDVGTKQPGNQPC